MKTTEKPLFSNSSDFMSWTARNCDRCYKHVEPSDDNPIDWRCSIDADIQGQVCGLMEIRQRSFDIVRGGDCPFCKETRPGRKGPRRIKGQESMDFTEQKQQNNSLNMYGLDHL